METKQHAVKQPMDQRGHQPRKKKKKHLETNEKETHLSKTYGIQLKQF